MNTYITFGRDHRHVINGIVYDKDCVAVITGSDAITNRERAFELFDSKFCFEYPEDYFDPSTMHYFPRGYVTTPTNEEELCYG